MKTDTIDEVLRALGVRLDLSIQRAA